MLRFFRFKFFLGLIVILIVGLGLVLSRDKVLSERHEPFVFSESFNFSEDPPLAEDSLLADGSFDDYITYSAKHLDAARVDSPSKEVLHNASPFIFEPGPECAQGLNGKYENGIVITHGLLASPYSMRPIGEYFQSRCFYVLGILLPDHVTRPGDFLDTRWQDWALVQKYALRILQQKTEKQFLSGHSAGATLASYEAAVNSSVDGLILFTPALQITAAAKYAKYIEMLSAVFPKAAWYEIREDIATYRYESITMSSADETYKLIQANVRALAKKPLTIPVFTVASIEDNTVDTSSILSFMAAQTHPLSRTLLYSQHAMAASDKVKVKSSSDLSQGVLSVSHLGIMLPASHQEYGREGDYRNCGHYFGQNNDNWAECKAGNRDYYGEVTDENLAKGLVERIAFNPFYEEMLQDLDEFLNEL